MRARKKIKPNAVSKRRELANSVKLIKYINPGYYKNLEEGD
jgi:hypothetical protein